MDWSKGYEALYYITFVDPSTWRDISRFDITEGSIKKTDGELRESADIKCIRYPYSGEQWIRVWLDAKQNGSIEHTPLFTGLATTPGKSFNGSIENSTLACFSVLKPADDILLERGWYAPAKTDGAALVKSLLDVIPAPVNIEPNVESPTLETPIIAEDGETCLTMAETILSAINWRLRINGLGEITICPINTDPVAIFDANNYDIIEPVFSMENDWYECPNCIRVISDNLSAYVKDEDPDSRYSIPNRQREIWYQEADCELNENESLAEYAIRRLSELQQVGTTMSYDRRFDPRVVPSDLVRIKYPSHNIDNVFVVTSQSIELGYGARTSEEVMMI